MAVQTNTALHRPGHGGARVQRWNAPPRLPRPPPRPDGLPFPPPRRLRLGARLSAAVTPACSNLLSSPRAAPTGKQLRRFGKHMFSPPHLARPALRASSPPLRRAPCDASGRPFSASAFKRGC
ncbi:hypothetical protein AAFF_G00392070 [Aldrovandia affinis]|uniref:Uncharacterized protein n=1 Tax=Aldrovandia affinis TaxID=143900 RepID=A0AAD7SE71_9TELE|nr:hypothetical protein AAFF_G00392070 [Aldrovandia affinis]